MTAIEMTTAPLYVVKASHHLNFYPGTLTPTPPEYRRTLVSEPMTRDAAANRWIEWIMAVESPGWDIRVEPAAVEGGEL